MSGQFGAGEPLLHSSLRTFRHHGLKQLEAHSLSDLALGYLYSGDDRATNLCGDAIHLFRAIGNERAAATMASNLAELEFRLGRLDSAIQLVTGAIESEPRGRQVSGYLANLAAYLVAAQRWAEARDRANEAIREARAVGEEVNLLFAVQHLAAAIALQPAADAAAVSHAARILGSVDARLDRLEATREYTEQVEYNRLKAALESVLGKALFEKLACEVARLGDDVLAQFFASLA
jgi:tetratricopeptide (TPR) repeat protein